MIVEYKRIKANEKCYVIGSAVSGLYPVQVKCFLGFFFSLLQGHFLLAALRCDNRASGGDTVG